MKILKEMPSFSDAEMYVYKYVIANPGKVIHMSITDLAAKTNTSTATVRRMCRKYGCEGFSAFRYKLQEELADPGENSTDTLDQSYQSMMHFFQSTTRSDAFREQMEKAADLLSKKKFIIFIGSGSSNIMAEYGSLYFSYLFNLSFRVEDLTNYPVDYFPRDMAKDICLVACSVSGQTAGVVQYVKNYHTGSTSIIAITANPRSALAELADVSITYSVPITMYGPSNLTTQVPAVYIIETLASLVRKKRESQSLDRD